MDWSDVHSTGFFQRSVDRLERLVEHGACGLKIWKDLGTKVRDADGTLLRVDDERLFAHGALHSGRPLGRARVARTCSGSKETS